MPCFENVQEIQLNKKGLRKMNLIYKESWLDSDFDSYLLYLDDLLINNQTSKDKENNPISFQEFRESIQA